MEEQKKTERRDRDGVIYENDLTEEDSASGLQREEGAEEESLDPDTDSQAGDEFMKQRYGRPNDRA